MTVGELLERISSRELSEWMAYYGMEPFGQERGDLQAGVVASVMANAWSGKRQKAFQPGDFLMKFNAPAKTSDIALTELSEEERKEKARALYAKFRAWADG